MVVVGPCSPPPPLGVWVGVGWVPGRPLLPPPCGCGWVWCGCLLPPRPPCGCGWVWSGCGLDVSFYVVSEGILVCIRLVCVLFSHVLSGLAGLSALLVCLVAVWAVWVIALLQGCLPASQPDSQQPASKTCCFPTGGLTL